MIFTIDAGNTHLSLALFKDDKVIKTWRISTSRNKSETEYELTFKQLFLLDNIDISLIKGVVFSSVVPEVTLIIAEALKFLNVKILFLKDENVKTNFKTVITGVERNIGADIIANIIAGKKLYKENFIIIDLGTATTFDIAIKDGEYVGSIIVPGVKTSIEALCQKASLLPRIKIKKPIKFLGRTTSEVMESGIYYSYLGGMREIINRIKSEFPNINFRVYATGGLSNVFIDDLDFVDGIVPELTSIGLNEVWNINNQ